MSTDQRRQQRATQSQPHYIRAFRRSRLRMRLMQAGVVLLGIVFVIGLLPSPYLVTRPGLVLNTLGEYEVEGTVKALVMPDFADDSEVENTGELNLLTVNISGNKDKPRSWISLLVAVFDPSQDIEPISDYYPDEVTVAEVQQESNRQMDSAQITAAAAALTYLGYPVGVRITVAGVVADTDAAAQLREGDVLLRVDGAEVEDGLSVVDAVQRAAGAPVTVELLRDGQPLTVSVKTFKAKDADRYRMGIYTAAAYDLPVPVEYAVTDIGGPSAGMMFTLAVIDKMLDEDLAAGTVVSGTGTVEHTGKVGAIGGLKQKLYAAERAGTELFLFAAENCGDLPDQVPGGMQLVAVTDIAEAVTAIRDYRDGKETAGLSACSVR